MIFVPFLFFAWWLNANFKRSGFNAASCMMLAYFVTSFFAIILYFQDASIEYENVVQVNIGVIPTLIYCFLIFLGIKPFCKFYSKGAKSLSPNVNTKLFNIISYTYILTFFVLILIFRNDLLMRLVYGDLLELRNQSYSGELDNAVNHMSGIMRIVATIFTTLAEGGYIMLVFFFYSICMLNKKKLFNVLLLISSLSPIIIGIIGIDRSKTVYWIVLFALAYSFFLPYFSSKVKTFVIKLSLLIGIALGAYLFMVTVARFGEYDSGSQGGFLYYIGQPFINFCTLWENISVPDVETYRVFPIYHYFAGTSGMELIAHLDRIERSSGIAANVFFSYPGMFLVDIGHLAAIIIPLLIYMIINSTINKIGRKSQYSLSDFIILFELGTIIQCGFITYFYTSMPRAVCFWLFIFLSNKLRLKIS